MAHRATHDPTRAEAEPRGIGPLVLVGVLAGFLAGLFLSYLLALHRRANAEWRY